MYVLAKRLDGGVGGGGERSDQYCHSLQWNFHSQQENRTTPSEFITKKDR